jgi:PAS domain S-box-containing protein
MMLVPNRLEHPSAAEMLTELNTDLFADVDDGRALARAIVDTIREPLLVLDKDLRVVTASRSFYLTFGLRHEDVYARPIYALGAGQWNIPELRSLLENIAPRHGVLEAYEVEQDFGEIGRRTMLLNARKVFYAGNSHTTILVVIEDITERRAAERAQAPDAALATALQAVCAQEEMLLQELRDRAQQQILSAQEFDHRLSNGLQLISSMLSLQSRAATPAASAQLIAASRRIVAFGQVHRRLHLLDHEDHVEFGEYLLGLCADLSDLLFEQGTGRAIVVAGDAAKIPAVRAIPLGFIVNELTTNSAKYGAGDVTVRFEVLSPGNYSLLVLDQGEGLPEAFLSTASKGLGLKIVLALVRQIGGALHLRPDGDGCRHFLSVTFAAGP